MKRTHRPNAKLLTLKQAEAEYDLEAASST
jgi:hypothetical protein